MQDLLLILFFTRPVSKSYVQALEGQIAALERVLRKLAVADDAERNQILSELPPSGTPDLPSADDQAESQSDHNLAAARVRSGQLRRLRASNAAQFFGSTSLFQIHLSKESPPGLAAPATTADLDAHCLGDVPADNDEFTPRSDHFQYAPHDETSQKLMATFFMEQYHYNMVVYREYFLRDYDVGSGKYYSDVLLYSICSLAALQYDDMPNLSDVFSGQAQTLLYSTLDSPDLATLQALVLLGYREIAVGRPYFGRPPALYPSESDVRNTIRLQYPPDWQGLLETYICKGASATEFEDGVSLVGSFIYQAELSKIIHAIITDLFENRRGGAEPAIVAAKSRRIHVSLTKWLSSLPGALHWNQWTVGQVPPYVLHLHMLFHTVMIILHRPPSHMFEKPGIAESEDVDTCYESLQAILRLMRSYSRYYRYRSLPLDFVHTLSTAAGTVIMKRFLQKASWNDPDIERALLLISEAMEEIRNTWPCVREIRDVLLQAQQTQATMPPEDPLNAPDPMNGLELGSDATGFLANLGDDIGTLITDEFLNTQLQVISEPNLESFDGIMNRM